MRIAQPFAAWLVARPQNAVLGLLASLVLPPTPILGAAVMTFLLLYEQSILRVALFAVLAATLLGVLNTVLGGSPVGVMRLAAVTWVPAAALGVLLRRSRSLTLTVQISAIATLIFTLFFFFSQSDTNAFGTSQVEHIATVMRALGFPLQADALIARKEIVSWQVNTLIVLALWSSFALALGLGTALYRVGPRQSVRIGGFSELNLGRVLAVIVVLACLVAMASGAVWLQSFAFVAFLLFWLQGLAVLHWLQHNGSLPMSMVIAVYVLLPFLNLILALALAMAGYLDAWFDFRKRLGNKSVPE